MEPTKEEAEAFLKWLTDPENKGDRAKVLAEISDSLIAILRKHHIV
jgi:hypothetical protein